jgi:hypothetical protein
MVGANTVRADDSNFRFEQTVEWTEPEYNRVRGTERPTRRGRFIAIAIGILGVVAFTSRWTAPVGLLLILLAVFLWFSPRIARRGAREEFKDASYLRGPVTYGVSDEGLWIRGGALRAESRWEGMRVWDCRHGWLLLAASGMPPVYLSEDQLRAAEIYDRVLQLANQHGVEYNGAARARKLESRLTSR